MPRLFLVTIAGFGLLAACAEFPELDRAISPAARRAGYPVLVPVEPILFAAFDGQRGTPAETAWLARRAAGLRARADGLRGPVIDAASRARMAAAVRRHYSGPLAPRPEP